MDYVDFDSLAQKLAPTLQVLENKRKELLRKGRSEGLIYAAIFLIVGVIALLILKLEAPCLKSLEHTENPPLST